MASFAAGSSSSRFVDLPQYYKMSKGSFDNSVNVYCNMITDGKEWTVIQRNKKGSSVNFNRNWTEDLET